MSEVHSSPGQDGAVDSTPAPQDAPPLSSPLAMPPADVDSAGFGRALARAREAQGIPAAEMAGRLRLHPRQLDAIENQRLDELPSAPFVRGYVRSYAKELKIDPAPLLAALGASLPAPATLVLAPPAGRAMMEVRRGGVERASRLLVIGGSVIALLILAIVGWAATTRVRSAVVSAPSASVAIASAPAVAAADPASAGAPGAGSPSSVASPGEPAIAVPGAAAGQAPAIAISAAGSVAPVAAEPAAALPPVVVGTAPPAVNGLRLQVSGNPSWIEVTDADGRVVFVGTLSSGAEQVLANLKSPLRLTIGNASTVTVTYRGKLVDLQPHIRANDLARLTLE